MSKCWLPLLTVALSASCSDATGPLPPPPETAPTVDLSVGFGDPPVTGLVTIHPQDSAESWSFSVDLDANGSLDATGEVGDGADVPFEFTTPGIHRIRIELSLEEERFQAERLVIVTDPSASEIIRTVAIPTVDEPDVILEGITIGTGVTELELYVAMSRAERVFHLDPVTLEVRSEVDLGPLGLNTLEGMDLDPTGETLYVVSKSHRLITLTAPDLTLEDVFPISGAAFTVHALSPGMVLTGGEGPVSLVDARDGTILNSRLILGAVNFAVSSDDTTIALIQRSENGRRFIRLLGVPSLDDLGTTELPAGFSPRVVAFEPSGSKVYVLGASGLTLVRFLVIDVATAEILTDQPLDGPGAAFIATIANPFATSFDGRFVVFPTTNGAYVVDTNLDLPLFRMLGCCNVAASPTTHDFYFAGTTGEVSIIRLNR